MVDLWTGGRVRYPVIVRWPDAQVERKTDSSPLEPCPPTVHGAELIGQTVHGDEGVQVEVQYYEGEAKETGSYIGSDRV